MKKCKCGRSFIPHAPRQFYCQECSSAIPSNRTYKKLKASGELYRRAMKSCRCGKKIWAASEMCKSCSIRKRNTERARSGKPYVTKRGEYHGNWKGDSVNHGTGRARAQKIFKPRPCEICGSKKTDRHHVDSNPMNNSISNISFLCRKHHIMVEKRFSRGR